MSQETLGGGGSGGSDFKPSDYNRKLALITDLINLHKSKTSGRTSITDAAAAWTPPAPTSLSDLEEEPLISSSSLYPYKTRVMTLETTAAAAESSWSSIMSNCRRSTSLGLVECTCEGDRVCVENCDLKRDCDLAGWLIERSVVGGEQHDSTTKVHNTTSCAILPAGSVVRSGKCLRVDMPFGARHNHVRELLAAVAKSSSSSRRGGVTVVTRLLAPDRTLVAAHHQEIPHFYREIFKYANLIQFLS